MWHRVKLDIRKDSLVVWHLGDPDNVYNIFQLSRSKKTRVLKILNKASNKYISDVRKEKKIYKKKLILADHIIQTIDS